MIGQKRRKLTKTEERSAYAIVTARDQDRCQRCGRQGDVERDHRQGRDAYNTVPSNLQALGGPFSCACHLWKTRNPQAAVTRGFGVPRWARDPAEWPAWRHGIGWVLYFDEQDEEGRWWQTITAEQAAERQSQLGLT